MESQDIDISYITEPSESLSDEELVEAHKEDPAEESYESHVEDFCFFLITISCVLCYSSVLLLIAAHKN